MFAFSKALFGHMLESGVTMDNCKKLKLTCPLSYQIIQCCISFHASGQSVAPASVYSMKLRDARGMPYGLCCNEPCTTIKRSTSWLSISRLQTLDVFNPFCPKYFLLPLYMLRSIQHTLIKCMTSYTLQSKQVYEEHHLVFSQP